MKHKSYIIKDLPLGKHPDFTINKKPVYAVADAGCWNVEADILREFMYATICQVFDNSKYYILWVDTIDYHEINNVL